MNRLLRTSSYKKGFNLIELLVALSIIGLLTSVAFANFLQAREQSRDNVRKNDIEQIALAMRLYVEQYGSDIDCQGGVKIDGTNTVDEGKCDDGAEIVAFLNSTYGAIPHDPLGPGSDTHYYYFDNTHTCNSRQKTLVFAVNMEQEPSNEEEICPQESNNNDGDYSFSLIDGVQSNPYAKELFFTREIIEEDIP